MEKVTPFLKVKVKKNRARAIESALAVAFAKLDARTRSCAAMGWGAVAAR
jgi:hypothetical protein